VHGNSELAPKGDKHTVVHNTAFDTDTDCSLCVFSHLGDAPMNENTEVLSNAATAMAGGGGRMENNYEGLDLTTLLVDAPNLDFRPVEGSALLLPSGDYMGAYGPGQETYWMPGHRPSKASLPIPADLATLARGRAAADAVMCRLGYRATRHDFYLGLDRCPAGGWDLSSLRAAVDGAGRDDPEFQYSAPEGLNVFQLTALEDGLKYFWRVDAVRDGHVFKGDIWRFHT
jgi:hypothetical protein